MSAVAEAAPDKLINRVEAAAILGLRPNTLAIWAITGRYNLPFIRCGRMIRYRASDLDKWLKSPHVRRS